MKKNALSNLNRFNYLYFGILFLALVVIHVTHILLIQKGSVATESFFIIYAVVQSFLEVLLLVGLGYLIAAYLPRIFLSIFMGMTIFLFLTHFVDFPLTRIMGYSVWNWLLFVSRESLSNFIEMLLSSNISIKTWMTGGASILFLTLCGVFFIKITEKIIRKKPFTLTFFSWITAVGCSFGLLIVWDVSLASHILAETHYSYQKALPWKSTIFKPDSEVLTVSHPLKKNFNEKEVLKQIDHKAAVLTRRPNIFLFIAESIREDFITSEITPCLHQFRSENIYSSHSFSSANATHLSWFSLFQSKLPFYWEKYQPRDWKTGSLPLSILKKMGYEIHVYSSSRLPYYQMDEIIFGKNRSLADGFHLFAQDDTLSIYEGDRLAVQKMQEDLLEKKEGCVFIVFLESTHFNYSWPENETLFKPAASGINYLYAIYSKVYLEEIKNRYRNSLHFIDGLFGNFLSVLKNASLYDDAIIMVTGDHGEEFYEHGRLFHGSDLSYVQTHVPIYYRLGKTLSSLPKNQTTSHLDIFPTIFHYLFGEEVFAEFFDGESILRQNKSPFTITASYNASRSPFEFAIGNGQYKMIAKFKNENAVFDSKELQVLSTKTLEDEPVFLSPSEIDSLFSQALEQLFRP